MKQVDGFFFRVRLLAFEGFRALDAFHVNRHFDFEHVDAVTWLAELPHTLGDDLWFPFRILQSLFVRTFLVADKLKEEGDVIGAALVANALDPGMLLVVHVLGIVGSVIEQNLDAVGARLFQAFRGPVVEQVAETSRTRLVVPSLFIGQQQAGVLGAALRSWQSPLGIKQYGAGMWRQHLTHQNLEFFHHFVGDGRALLLGERLLQRASLVHGSSGNHSAFVRYGLYSGEFAGSELHTSSRVRNDRSF